MELKGLVFSKGVTFLFSSHVYSQKPLAMVMALN